MAKKQKPVTSEDRISAGLDPWNHPMPLRETLFQKSIVSITLPMIMLGFDSLNSSAKPLLIGSVLTNGEVFHLAELIKCRIKLLSVFQAHAVLTALGVSAKDHFENSDTDLLEIRLREINAKYRKSIALGLPNTPTVKQAFDVIAEELRNDPSYRISWQANIAMVFYDEFRRATAVKKRPNHKDVHAIANQAADNFLTTLTAMSNIKAG